MSIYLGSNQIDTINLIQYLSINNDLEDVFIEGTISNYTNSECSFIRATAFGSHMNLISVDFPNCTSIDAYGFAWCEALTTVSFPKCSYIGKRTFYECYSLASVNLPQVITIGEEAFTECYSLTSINLPQATTIGNNVFNGCSSLISVSLPQATTIGSYAFGYCYSLISINLSQATTIGNGVFNRCYSLISISLPQATSIGSNTFAHCSSLTSISLLQATTIGNSAFYSCRSLTSVSLPQATIIGSYAFCSCYALTSINLPQAITIGSSAFAYCASLTSINLPQMTTIGSSAFAYCYNLLSLYLLGSSIPTLVSIGAFYSTPISNYIASTSGVYGSIYVPTSLYSSYIVASNWSVYSARIVGVGTMTINYYMDAYSEDYLYEPSMTWADWVNSKYNTVGFVVTNNGYIGILDDETGLYHYLEDSNAGDEVLSSELVADYANIDSLYMGIYLSKSGFDVIDNSSEILYFIYEIDMTWAEWVNSNYNTVNFVVDPETSYVRIWDDVNNTYAYLFDYDGVNPTNAVISTHKIVEDMSDKSNISFTINTTLNGGN